MAFMLWITTVLCLGFTTSLAAPYIQDTEVQCRPGWVKLHHRCYKFFIREKETWEGAVGKCESLGAELSSIQSIAERDVFADYLKKHSGINKWWVGFQRRGSTGNNWTWMDDGEKVQPKIIPWHIPKMADRPGNMCGQLRYNVNSGLKIATNKCTKKSPFFCEYLKINRPSTTTTTKTTTSATALTTLSPTTVTTTPSATTIEKVHQKPTLRSTSSRPSVTLLNSVEQHHTTATSPASSNENAVKAGRIDRAEVRRITVSEGSVNSRPSMKPETLPSEVDGSREVEAEDDEDDLSITTHLTTHISSSTDYIPVLPNQEKREKEEAGDFASISTKKSTFTTRAMSKTPVTHQETLRPVFPTTWSEIEATESDTDDLMSVDDLPPEDKSPDTDTGDPMVDTDSTADAVDAWTDETEDMLEDLFTTDGLSTTINNPTTKADSFGMKTPDPVRPEGTTFNSRRKMKSTPNPRNQRPATRPTTRRPFIRLATRKSRVDLEAEFLPFKGCYIPGVGSSLRRLVENAKKFYDDDDDECPATRVRGLVWPETDGGQVAVVPCRSGKGVARFTCGLSPVCWQGEPDTSGCASPKLRALLKRIKTKNNTTDTRTSTGSTITAEPATVAPPTIDEAIEVTSQLVEVTAAEQETTVDDVLLTSQVITAFTRKSPGTRRVRNKDKVKAVVNNVVKTGSILVSPRRRRMWQKMSDEDKVRSASSLLVALDTATASLVEEIEEPTLLAERDENMELELRVLDIEQMEVEERNELVYDAKESENTFTIPVNTLKSLSKGRLAKAVFITHYSMSDILGDRDEHGQSSRPSGASGGTNPTIVEFSQLTGSENVGNATKSEEASGASQAGEKGLRDDNKKYTGPRIASYILSASIGADGHMTKLPEPITFSMRHVLEMDKRHIPLCSFWDASNGMYQGFWSQEGCRVVHSNRTHTKCECDHMTNFAVLMDLHGVQMSAVHTSVLRTVTIIGCCISCIALLASFLTFCCFTSIQGERNTIHKHLSLCLLLAELLFVCGIDQAEHQMTCAVISGFLHFLFLCSFCWMFVEGVHIIFMLVQVFDAQRSRLPYYYLTGYGVPTVIVGFSLIFFHEGYGTDKFCWLTTERYFIWAFAGPVAIVLLVNAIFLAYALKTVWSHADYVFSSKEKATGSGLRSWVQGALALEVLLGLTWAFGYLMLNDVSLPVAYIFTVLNSLQGLFIFVFHCGLNKKIQKEYIRVMQGVGLKRSPSSRGTQSSNTRRTSNSNNHTNNRASNGEYFRARTNSNSNMGTDNGQGNIVSTGEPVMDASVTVPADRVSLKEVSTFNSNGHFLASTNNRSTMAIGEAQISTADPSVNTTDVISKDQQCLNEVPLDNRVSTDSNRATADDNAENQSSDIVVKIVGHVENESGTVNEDKTSLKEVDATNTNINTVHGDTQNQTSDTDSRAGQ